MQDVKEEERRGSVDDSREQQGRMHFSRIESSRAGMICIAYHNIV